MGERTIDDLRQKQALPLEVKILLTRERVRQWVNEYGEDGVYISFSGGKDSTVLLDLVRNRFGYKNIPAVFVDVPTQFPELKAFARNFKDVEILKSEMAFNQVCEEYGFPLISKEVSQAAYEARLYLENKEQNIKKYKWGAPTRILQFQGRLPHTEKGVPTGEYSTMYDKSRYAFLLEAPFKISHFCCLKMKKEPLHGFEEKEDRKPITGQMAEESMLRKQKWLQFGCNGFQMKRPISNPMSFWTENDVLQYIAENKLPICSVYGEIVEDFGDQLEGQMDLSDYGLAEPEKKYKTTGCKRTGSMLCGFGCHLEKPGEGRFEMLKQTHPKMYQALDLIKNNGVTFREAIEWTNEHGNLNIRI